MGLDVMYSKLNSATAFDGLATGGARRLSHRALSVGGGSLPRTIRTTGRSGSACIATSIPDRVIMDV